MKNKIEIEVPEGKKAEKGDGDLTLVKETVKDDRPITERIKSFQDAIKELGSEHPLVVEFEMFQGCDCAPQSEDLLAYLKLRIITKALNEGWEPKFVKGEYRWAPYFLLYTKEEIEKMNAETRARVVCRSLSNANAYGGVSYAYASYDSAVVYAYIGSRLAFKSEELAEYAGKQFTEIYADFCFKP